MSPLPSDGLTITPAIYYLLQSEQTPCERVPAAPFCNKEISLERYSRSHRWASISETHVLSIISFGSCKKSRNPLEQSVPFVSINHALANRGWCSLCVPVLTPGLPADATPSSEMPSCLLHQGVTKLECAGPLFL